MPDSRLKITLLRWWPALVLLALTLLFFHKLAFSGLILGRGDTYAYFYPYWAARNAAFMEGQSLLWSPAIFAGVPLLANPQPGWFYPPNWPLIPLSPPDGIRLSVLIHIFWALLGAYLLARRWLNGSIAALAAAAVFGLGGYTGAHVEQINQLQGLAWLPWLFWLYQHALARPRRYLPLLAMALALQFLTGHTQTVFISAVGLGAYGLAAQVFTSPPGPLSEFREGEKSSAPDPLAIEFADSGDQGGKNQQLSEAAVYSHRVWFPLRRILQSVLILAFAGVLMLPLIVPQLIPTMELTGISNRSGGLNPNEATAFSFHPLIIGRGLLPSYDSIVFGEYVAYAGVIGLSLAIIGLLVPRRSEVSRARWVWAVVALLGLLLAFGEFNPLYWQLAHLPGFSFFRVPARWLALFALGVGLLAGAGLQWLLENPGVVRVRQIIPALLVIGLLAVSSTLAVQTPQDVIGPAAPTAATWTGWGLALVALIVCLFFRGFHKARSALLLLAVTAELFLAAQVLPYNTLVLPESYHAQRFTISQLLAYGAEQNPPGRMLGSSDLLFDPGDRAALENRYAQYGFSETAVRINHIATKLKEIVAPNLPLIWNIPTFDGFDGGLLPSRHYTAFSKLLLPPDSLATIDGRLREILSRDECRGLCLPDMRWLNLTNTRYLVTDKVFDLWHEGVAYDTTFAANLAADDTLTLENPAAFTATAMDVLYTGGPAPLVTWDDGAPLALENDSPALDGLTRDRWSAPDAFMPESVTIHAAGPAQVRAVSLVDTRTGDFVQLVVHPDWQRVLSSDIKLYENQAVLPRAFVVFEAISLPDTDLGTASALEMMRDPAFDPAQTALLHAPESAGRTRAQAEDERAVTIRDYTAERVVIDVQAGAAGYLVLTDAYYPGWAAQVNGTEMPIYRADIVFRAVEIPAGQSEVIFELRPAWYPGAQLAGLAAWLILTAVTFILWRRF